MVSGVCTSFGVALVLVRVVEVAETMWIVTLPSAPAPKRSCFRHCHSPALDVPAAISWSTTSMWWIRSNTSAFTFSVTRGSSVSSDVYWPTSSSPLNFRGRGGRGDRLLALPRERDALGEVEDLRRRRRNVEARADQLATSCTSVARICVLSKASHTPTVSET